MPKENDLEGQQDMGGKHGGQAGTPKQLQIGCTALVWNVFPRAPEPLETAVRDMSELGYKGFETFGQVVEDWDKNGTLDTRPSVAAAR